MRLSYRFYLASCLIGIISGLICTAFRYLIYFINDARTTIFRKNGTTDFQRIIKNDFDFHIIFHVIIKYVILLVFIIIILNIVNFLIEKFPTTSGSGLPQTKALLRKKMEYKSPFQNIIAKFFGGILSISSGLSFGREGSSVQMGSLIGYIFGKSFKVEKENENYLIAAGAGAGISAAFTAPLASSILILESLRNSNTSDVKKTTIATLLSGLCAGIIAIFFFPTNIYSSISIIKPDIKEFQLLIIFILMAILFAIIGKLFSDLLIFIKINYTKTHKKHDNKNILLALLLCIITFFHPSIVGGNQTFAIEIIESDSSTLAGNIFIVVVLSALTIISNATGFPGGIFIPLLSIGAILGKIFCIALSQIDVLSLSNTGYFVIIGMSVFFIAVVRTPLTGFILISEMTGNYETLFPTLVVGILTYIITEILRVRPLDDILYDIMLKENRH